MSSRKHIIITAFFICISGLFVSAANAEPITINLTATVNFVNGADILDNKIHIGSIITGSYTYESTTLDTNPSSQVGDYWHYSQPAGISLTVGGFEFKTDPTNVNFVLEVVNDYPTEDDYGYISYNNLSLSNGASVGDISWFLSNPTGTALTSTALPVTAPILNQWQSNDLFIDGDGYHLEAAVDSVEVVPEPGTILLLTLGTIAIRRRRHFQN